KVTITLTPEPPQSAACAGETGSTATAAATRTVATAAPSARTICMASTHHAEGGHALAQLRELPDRPHPGRPGPRDADPLLERSLRTGGPGGDALAAHEDPHGLTSSESPDDD